MYKLHRKNESQHDSTAASNIASVALIATTCHGLHRLDSAIVNATRQ
jgi:hypothetical protein